MPRRTLRHALLAAALTLAPAAAVANGRFPASGYLVAGPGAASDVIALRTTFGLVTSTDGGRSWGWTCEEATRTAGTVDPSVSVGFDGALVVATPTGVAYSRDGCAWSNGRGVPARPLVDIAHDPTGRFMVTAVGPTGMDDALWVSNDGGASWTAGASLPGMFTETVEVAPSRPSRVYVTGFLRGGIAVLLRSDDGGMTVREVTRDFGRGSSAFLAAVDPTDPDVVYVRAAAGLGAVLLRSSDGGTTFREIAATDADMPGFALSDDGATVWIGSFDRREGIRRSVRGGPFTRVGATVSVRCLRYHAGLLYVCTDEVLDGYMLGCSADGGDHVAPLFSARLLAGPSARCAASSTVGDTCTSLWPTQRSTLAAIDGGATPMLVTHDVALDAVADAVADTPRDLPGELADAAPDATTQPDAALDAAPDAVPDVTPDVPVDAAPDAVFDAASDAALDAVAAPDVTSDGGRSPPPPPPRDCACRAGSARAEGGAGAVVAAGFVASAWASRRRRPRARRG